MNPNNVILTTDSKAFHAVEYSSADRKLRLVFRTALGFYFEYDDVGPEKFQEFMSATSKRGYWKDEIKPLHAEVKLPCPANLFFSKPSPPISRVETSKDDDNDDLDFARLVTG